MRGFPPVIPGVWLMVILFIFTGFFLCFPFSIQQTHAAGNAFALSGIVQGLNPWAKSGNAGSIWFTLTSDPDLNPYIDEDFYLHGSFWSSNVGWISFDHGDSAVTQAYMDCPLDILSGGLLCNGHGYAWSQNAGWIHLGDDTSISSISSLQFNPDTLTLIGFGYSSTLGWIPFTGIGLNTVSRGFQGRAYVIGNIAGTRALKTEYNSITDTFDSISFSKLLRDMRKRYVEMSRGYDYTNVNTTLNYRLLKDQDLTIFGDWTANSEGWIQNNIRTYIVVGGDVILEGSISNNELFPRAIIVLKNSSGSGGNIFIKGNLSGNSPDVINTSLIAEGSIYSGRKNLQTPVYYIDQSLLKIPISQLYVHGSIISRNTIGGAGRSNPVCPVLVENCTAMTARKYDFNYFRNFVPRDEKTSTGAAYNLINRAYTKPPLLDDYSFIIEYDSRILIDPPPGLDIYTIK